MARLNPVDQNANPKSKELLAGVQKGLGMVPNMMSTMAQSPAVLQAYLGFQQNMSRASISEKLRQAISLAVSELNQCHYCLAAHTMLGRKAGLSESEILDARHGTASDKKTEAAVEFARKIAQDRGHVSDQDVDDVRQAGYTEGEIAEIIAAVALITFTNYFNIVADSEIDFPLAPALAAV